MFRKLIITIGLIILTKGEIAHNEPKWLQNFAESIQNNREIYQVIFFLDEKITTKQTFNNLLIKLSKMITHRKIDTPNSKKATKFDLITYNPRISLFILPVYENDLFDRLIDFLIDLSESKRRPKCLLLLFNEIENYPQFFENLWTYQFLDVTIIKIATKFHDQNLTKNYHIDFKVIHYNPFLKSITNEIPCSKTVWFPNKLKNMHRYPLVVNLLNAPPGVFVPRDPKREIYGLGVTKLKSLQRIMNFTLVKAPFTIWGKLTCSKESSTDVGLAIITNKIQILGNEESRRFCNGRGVEFSKSLKEIRTGLAVPLIKNNKESVRFQWQIKHIIIVMIVPIIFWIISRFLHFSAKKWKMDYMFRITLGTVIPTEPEITVERIIFLAILFGSFIFSSDIYTAINQVQLETASTFRFETLDDVLASNVEIMINKNHFLLMNATDDIVLQQILKKSVWMYYPQDECLERLLKYKNLTCVLEVTRAEMMLRNRRDKCGGPLVKFFTDKFPSDSGATILGEGVPYAKRIDQVIQRVIDSGIKEKWLEPYSAKNISPDQIGKSCGSNQMESVMTIHELVFLLVIGFGCSTFIFISELIMYRVVKNKGTVIGKLFTILF